MSLRSRTALSCLAILVVTLVAYAPAIVDGGFIWDDDDYVTENELLTAEDGLRRIWFEPSASPQYYPLVFTSFRIERALFGDGPFAHHLTNVLLHALNAMLVFFLVRRLGMRGGLIAAFLFALHPVHVESVAWITERKNVLSGFFALLSLLIFLRSEKKAASFSPGYLLALCCFALALLAKTIVATLAPTLLLLAWWRRGRIERRDWLAAAPFFLLGLAAGLMTAITEVAGVRASGPEWDLSLAERLLIAGRSVVFYAGKIFWPEPLAFNYERWSIDLGSPWQWAPPIVVVALMVLLVRAALRGKLGRGPATALLLYAGTLFPALGFLNVYPMRYSFVADHFQYLASLALLVPLAHHLAGLGSPRRSLPLIAILLMVLGAFSYRQCRIYESQEILWQDTLRKNPRSWIAWNNLGTMRIRSGDLSDAKWRIDRALELAPHAREILNNAGTLAAKVDGDPERAIALFRRALMSDPKHLESRTNLALMLSRGGDFEEAVAECDLALEEAARLGKDYAQARWIKAGALHGLGRHRRALREIDLALAMLGPNPEALALKAKIVETLAKRSGR